MRFDARQLHAKAKVDAGTEHQMRIGKTVELKLLRVDELGRISIGRGDERQDEVSATKRLSEKFGVTRNKSGFRAFNRRRESCQFLHRTLHAVDRISEQVGLLLRILLQRDHAVFDEVRRCFKSGDQQQKDHREEFILVELVAVGFSAHQI